MGSGAAVVGCMALLCVWNVHLSPQVGQGEVGDCAGACTKAVPPPEGELKMVGGGRFKRAWRIRRLYGTSGCSGSSDPQLSGGIQAGLEVLTDQHLWSDELICDVMSGFR
ncbi:hypothetical protein DPEC_G00013810 [Dallia pectoralis]|uniref:Uncharacterized protein n=1 Tax=Dallia pectoralis TaxID=75939 RepID=A0ACC2HMC6_DALPE|nr:hypothetical protein DPEC_G00013810 [Dallia pectoralis]